MAQPSNGSSTSLAPIMFSPAPTPTGDPSHPPAPPPINEPNGGTDQPALRAELETLLLRLSQDLYEMEICAGEVGPGMQDAVPKYLSRINRTYAELEQLSRRITDTVPTQIIEGIDNYRNPHIYTRNTVHRAVGENQYALGRALGLESFRRQLHESLSREFPDVELPERRHQPPWEAEARSRVSEPEEAPDSLEGGLGAIKEEEAPREPKPPSGPANGTS